MRPLLLAVLVFLFLATATSLSWGESDIGLYITPAPTLLWVSESILVARDPGLYDIYLVCTQPMNQHTGLEIETIGGFELNLRVPEGWFINNVALPPNVLDFNPVSHAFYCAGFIPVTTPGDLATALLATITLGTFLEQPPVSMLYIEPYYAPSLPGQMAITDADDDFSISPAFSISGDFSNPIFQINYPVPNKDQSWGDVKALYR